MRLSERVAAFIESEALLEPGQSLVVGVSGGPDSLCLLDCLKTLGFQPVVAYFDHRLRTESSADGEFVRQVAEGFTAAGERVLRLEFVAAIGQEDPHDRVKIDGEPPIDLVLRGGVHGDVATSAMLLNSIGALRAAEPGLHTMATIRPPRCQLGEGL